MNEILQSLISIEKEKSIKKEVLLEVIKTALVSACKKTYSEEGEYEIDIDPITADIRVLRDGEPVNDPNFGRIAAQTAKQVIIQKIREAERDNIFEEYSKKVGDIVSGGVHRVDRKGLIVDLGNADAYLPFRELIPGEDYKQGQSVRAIVLRVSKGPRGPEIILSRTSPEFVKRLFEMEVPEINEGIVEIKGASRDAGARTKIAVISNDDKVDCVGSCVGMRGQRVKNIVRELQGEKIDIVRYSSDAELYIRNALSPAELNELRFNNEEKQVDVLVEDDQLSLAIGKKGQNIRLAAILTGWRIDIKSSSQKFEISDLEGVGDKTTEILKEFGINSVKDIIKLTAEDLEEIPGIGKKMAEKIIYSAQKLIVSGVSNKESDEKKSDDDNQLSI